MPGEYKQDGGRGGDGKIKDNADGLFMKEIGFVIAAGVWFAHDAFLLTVTLPLPPRPSTS